jgi:hypothetical protein
VAMFSDRAGDVEGLDRCGLLRVEVGRNVVQD